MSLAQQLVPEMRIKTMIACRGTERYRTMSSPPGTERYPWRKTVIVDRSTGAVRDLGPPEEWIRLPKLRQTRKTGPARISLTMFGELIGHGEPSVPASAAAVPKEANVPEVPSMVHPSVLSEPLVAADEVMPPVECGAVPNMSHTSISSEGWAPRIIPKSGPQFLKLELHEQRDLRRLHRNLGHPDPSRMVKFLKERGAKPEIIRGCEDMQCDVCLESQGKPKLSQPSRIHGNLDFNDVVGCDGAYWTSAKGHKYHFMHFIDEATLFHVGVPSDRHFEAQVHAFETAWTQWAGPCRLLYMDPAGEYNSEEWAQYLQSENIKASMIAAEAHWQNGRCEVHGRIVKDMLTRMDQECPVGNADDFRRNLRQAFAAKNSLSRVHGFTPEQCLLGKSRALPGSLTADEEMGSHALAESDSTEGLWFRESLKRREVARRAFVQADNDSAFRRALLRRSRPGIVECEAGDWVLYWRRAKTNSRLERGRWHGPAQVIVVEGKKVVWLSHLGRLIRASPEQLRPASLREYQRLPKGGDGIVLDEQPHGRGFVSLGDDLPNPEIAESEGYSPSLGEDLPPSNEGSQPENEMFPPESIPSETSQNGDTMVGDDKELEPHEIPVPEDDDDEEGLCAFGDDVEISPHSGIWEIELCESQWNNVKCSDVEPSSTQLHVLFAEQILVASTARKQKVEVKYRDLSVADQELFDTAKSKEIKAWIDHGTVQKVARGSLRSDQIMRCRWILTWKAPEVGGVGRRAKARLVVLGFEDPGLAEIPRDAPTLSKDGRQLLLQLVASNRWDLLNFDISTAFLKGQGDGRTLGIHPPEELKQALKMQNGDPCLLKGGAYGRVDAPYLWYCELKRVLVELGFVVCPFDGCLFSLITEGPKGKPLVRGVLGIHVDDGIGGGDSHFHDVLQQLRKRFSFGAYNQHEFDFCGVHYKQWDDGTIELDQREYIHKIEPLNVPKNRRAEPDAPLTDAEKQCLRGLCGSLQFAAVHSRPDLSAKVGQLQASIPGGRIKDMLEGNRILYEGKQHAVCLLIVPIPVHEVTFCAFSDASFATANKLSSRQGTLIFSTSSSLGENQKAVVCPMAWSSRKIPRVVTSTLSAEAIALSHTLDRLSFIRISWEWLKNPSIDWASPEAVLEKAPRCNAVTDCKSVFDVATKNAPPACSEYRTLLECLLIRERLQENVSLRWINSQAMLADSLTKSMDARVLRECLRSGRYSLFDEKETLKQRATKRERLKWLQDEPGALHESK